MAAKELIATATVGAGGATTIDFTSIPQDGTDLYITISAKSGGSWPLISARFNGDTTYTNYVIRTLDGSSGNAASETNNYSNEGFGMMPASTDLSNTFGSNAIHIANYTGSTAKNISLDGLYEINSTTYMIKIIAGSWSGTSAITSITIWNPANQGFSQGSSASLYKFTKGSGGATVS